MTLLFIALTRAIDLLRVGLFFAAATVAVLAGLDWLVRTRRISPFSALGRGIRGVLRPLVAPVERQVVRAGGLPSAAPWWTLVFLVVGGIIALSALEFVRDQMVGAYLELARGPRGVLRVLLGWTFSVVRIALIVRIIISWIRPTRFVWWARWSVRLTDWLLRPIRQFIPPFGPLDLSPMIAWLLLGLLQGFLMRLT